MSRQGKIWRAAALCLALLMAVMPSMAVQAAGSAEEQTAQEQDSDVQEQALEVIHIRTVSDYVSVAEQCHYDAWSADKKIVLEADLVLYNPDLISKYQYHSNFLAVPTETTNDWCFDTKNNIITALKVGGTNCHHVFGISYWNETDGARLCEDIKKVYEMPGGKERFWDQVPLEYCQENYRVEVRTCTFNDIIEIDSFSDLKKIDGTYC